MTSEQLYALSDEELLSADLSSLNQVKEEQDETNTSSDEPMQSNEQTADNENNQDSFNEQDSKEEESHSDATLSNGDSDSNDEIDYKAFYESMTTPFKANGREVQITNANDAIRLMQQGVNYSKRMEELKPKRALLKALEDNGLDDKDKLGFLIDLSKKNPQAIAKLVKDSGLDVYELDNEQLEEYQPNLTLTEPNAFEDMVYELSSNDPNFMEALSHIGNWDNESKTILFNKPEFLRVIAEQKASGFFDKVVNIVDNERLFGRLKDMSYLQAYSQIETLLLEQEKSFTAPRPEQSSQETSTDVNKKKKASTPTNGTSSNQTLTQSDLYKLSDDELIKLIESGEL